MLYKIMGKNIEVTPGLRAAVEDKIGKLERYFTPDTEVIVTLSVQKERQKIEVTIPMKGNIIRAEETSNDMYVSIDLVEEIIERQIKKYKKKLIDKKQSALSFSEAFIQEEYEADDDIQIVKTKKFAVKPMDPEVQKKILGDEEPITCRPADLIEPELPKFEKECAQWKRQPEDVLSYALFPAVAKEFFEYRDAQDTGIDKKAAKDGAYPV